MTRIVSLSDICDVRVGRTPRRDTPSYWGGPFPWVTIRDLNGKVISSTREGLAQCALDEVMPPAVPVGTLLFSFKLTIGRIGFAGVPLHTNEAIAALPIRDPSRVIPEYLAFALQSVAAKQETNHAVLGKVLNKSKVENIRVPLPCLDEQRRIVDLLTRAEGIRRLAEEAQAKARDLIPALFVDMFGDPATNPKGWQNTCFSRAAKDITSRVTAIKRRDYLSAGQYPIYDQGQAEIGGYWNDSTGIFETTRDVVLFGDHTRVFRRAKGAFFRGADGLKVLEPTEGFNAIYLCVHWTIRGLPDHGYSRHFKFLKEVPVMQPPIGLQLAFARLVADIEDYISLCESFAMKAKALSHSLMSELFTHPAPLQCQDAAAPTVALAQVE